ncbi:hypothetical protein FRB98_001381 [Tulasnella sp. 332]|nr:hypothetical protein FRB98_001381 [Tulasnella sp. 332]
MTSRIQLMNISLLLTILAISCQAHAQAYLCTTSGTSGSNDHCNSSSFGTAGWIGLTAGLGVFLIALVTFLRCIFLRRGRKQQNAITVADPELAISNPAAPNTTDDTEPLPIYIPRPPSYECVEWDRVLERPGHLSLPPKAHISPTPQSFPTETVLPEV